MTKKALGKTSPKKAKAGKSTKARRPATGQGGVLNRIKGEVGKISDQLYAAFTIVPKDIVAAIKEDHKSLRDYLGVLKDTDKDMTQRRRAYEAFSVLLKSHSDSEAKAVYAPTMKLAGHEMHLKVAEGYVEHHLADVLMKRIAQTTDALTWSAHVNVLAETIEHHLKEEERDLLPKIRKAASLAGNAKMLETFVALRKSSQKKFSKNNGGVLETVGEA